jgi:pyrroline-5-carboxylate reductase
VTELSQIKSKVGFIGAGNMASALVRGLVKGGYSPELLLVTDLAQEKLEELSQELGVKPVENALAIAQQADVVVLAVKPGAVVPLLKSIPSAHHGALWLSVAAGVSCAAIEEVLSPDARVVRAMPNTPALVGEGATGLCSGSKATREDLALAETLLGAVGITEVVYESMMDAVTGVSGSAPAYVMLMIEAMADGAVRVGLPRDTALRLAAQTVRGAATMLLETGKHPGALKDMVTSPGGTTIAAVAALEENGFRHALISAVTAAALKSKALSEK